MGKTSTAVKARYNAKTYKRWLCDLRNDEYEKVEALRSKLGLSRAQMLKLLIAHYTGESAGE